MADGEQKVLPTDVEEGKALAAMGYVGPLFLVPLLAKKENAFCEHHGKQGAVLFGLEVIVGIALFILSFIITFLLSGVGGILTVILWFIFLVCVVGLSVRGFVTALRGEYREVPFLGRLAEKMNF
jgi:uncharacterized membrane protein